MNELVTDLKSLELETLKNLKNSKAANTLRAYQADFKDFTKFCFKIWCGFSMRVLFIYSFHDVCSNLLEHVTCLTSLGSPLDPKIRWEHLTRGFHGLASNLMSRELRSLEEILQHPI